MPANASAYERLAEAGAHILRCNSDKSPMRGASWKRPATGAEIAAHERAGGMFGVVPGSLGLVVQDVDYETTDSQQLTLQFPPVLVVPTRRGRHVYYDRPTDMPKIGNGKWQAGAAYGDIRCDAGYVCLHGDAATRLADCIEGRPQFDERKYPPPCLFEHHGIALPKRTQSRRRAPAEPRTKDIEDTPELRRLEEILANPMLADNDEIREEIVVGTRNNSLFDIVRFWAYSNRVNYWRKKDWFTAVRNKSCAVNATIPVPLPLGEVIYTADSIADYVFRHFPPRVKAREGALKRAALARARNAGRDAAIVRARDAGASWREIARRFEISHATARRVYLRENNASNRGNASNASNQRVHH